jgi:hypothetical protein
MKNENRISLTFTTDDRQKLLDIYNALKANGVTLDNPKHPNQPSMSAIIHYLIEREIERINLK